VAIDPIQLARDSFRYFEQSVHPVTGLVRDRVPGESPATIAGSGFWLACLAVAAERGWLARPAAAAHARTALRFLLDRPERDGPDSMGHHGFFYHFLDFETGRRHGRSELSTIDSATLFAGALTAAAYFDGPGDDEATVRALADTLYRRANWKWATAGGSIVRHGWRPGRGFIRYGWGGYDEAAFLYVLGLGSPTHPLKPGSWDARVAGYPWRRIYGQEHAYAGPLFIHQLSHMWIDFRGIRDAWCVEHDIDCFENSRRAVRVQREYAIRNPRGFAGYGADCWGITASDGPGPARRSHDGRSDGGRSDGGRRRRTWGYHARGAPWGPDDGTLSPWAVAASLPFEPDAVMAALAHIEARYPEASDGLGPRASFNPTFVVDGRVWVSPRHFAIDQGPVVLMVENHLSGLVWRSMRSCPYVVRGLERAGFAGGWMEDAVRSVQKLHRRG
jgi:hypothetical protein